MFCPECGKKIEEGALFCPECGTKITKQAQPQPADSAPPQEASAPAASPNPEQAAEPTQTPASTAANAGPLVDYVFTVTGRDRRNGAFRLASATADALVRNYICHCKSTSITILTTLYHVPQKNQPFSEIFLLFYRIFTP